MALNVPTNTSVNLRAVPDARQTTAASTETLAGGLRAQAALGNALQKAGTEGANIALKMQQEKNVTAVASADVALGEKQLAFEQEAKSLRGQQVEGLDTKAKEFWDKTISDTAGSLENDAQRRAFYQRAEKARLSSLERIGAHQRSETEKAALDSLNASTATSINEMAANANDPQAIANGIEDIKQKANAAAVLKGWDAATKDAYLSEKMTAAHKAAIDALVEHDPAQAEAYYKAHKDQIAGTDRATIEKTLEAGTRLGKAQSAVDKIVKKGGTYSDQLEAARKIGDPEQRKLAVSMVKQREAEKQSIVKADQQAAEQQVASMIAANTARADIPVKLWDRMDGAAQLRMEKVIDLRAKQAMRPNPNRSQRVYFDLLDAAHTKPDEFAKEDLSMYIGVVDPSKLTELKKLQSDPPERAVSRNKSEIIKSAVAGVGLNPKDLTKRGDDGDKVRAFYDRMDREIEAAGASGQKVTPKDIQDIADRMTIDVVKERSGWFDDTRKAGVAEVEGVPTDVVDELAAAVKSAGQPVTDANIKQLYQYMQSGRYTPTGAP